MLLSGIALRVGIATLIPFPDVIRRMFGSEEKFRRKTEELRKEAEVRADEWEKTFDKIEALKRKADALGPFPGEKGATEASSLREKGNPIRVGWNVQEVKLTKRIEPVYPELAKRARVSGFVILQVTVDEEGNVSQINMLRGHPLFDDSAVQAVREWKYSPTLLNGKLVPVIAIVPVIFNLR